MLLSDNVGMRPAIIAMYCGGLSPGYLRAVGAEKSAVRLL